MVGEGGYRFQRAAHSIVCLVSLGIREFGRECETFVADVGVESSEVVRCGVAQGDIVLVVNHAVTVLVHIAYVACLVGLAVGVDESCLVCFSLSGIDAFGLQPIEFVGSASHAAHHLRPVAEGGQHLFVAAQRLHFVVRKGDVATDNPFKIAQADERCL